MGTLSIFIDELGDYGKFGKEINKSKDNYSDSVYIISIIFHDQSNDISENLRSINYSYSHYKNDRNKYIHFGSLIRREDDFYKGFTIEEVRSLLFSFSRLLYKADINCFILELDKTSVANEKEAKEYFKTEIEALFSRNNEYFKI